HVYRGAVASRRWALVQCAPPSDELVTDTPSVHFAAAHEPEPRTYVTTEIRPVFAGSAAIPGTKLSKPVPATRDGAVHVTPSVEVESTIVFPAQPVRKTQSAHATYMRPDASTVAVGSGGARRKARGASLIPDTPTGERNVAPPSAERTA